MTVLNFLGGLLFLILVAGWFAICFYFPGRIISHCFNRARKDGASIAFQLILGEAIWVLLSYSLSICGIPLGNTISSLILLALIGASRFVGGFHIIKLRSVFCAQTFFAFAPFVVAALMMYSLSGAQIFDVWGSPDLSAYWSSADYLQSYSLQDDYDSQLQFKSVEASRHMNYYGRAGIMTLVASLGSLTPWMRLGDCINPLLVLNLSLLVALVADVLKSRDYVGWLSSLLITLSPCVLLNIYYTYLSQAVALPFILALIVCISERRHAHRRQNTIVFAILFGALLLVYEATLPAACLLAGWSVILAFRDFQNKCESKDELVEHVLALAIAVLLVSKNLRIAILRLLELRMPTYYPGWDWERVASSFDVVGITSPLSVISYATLPFILRLTEDVLIISIAAYGLFHIRSIANFLIIFTVGLLYYASALISVLNGRANATHMVVKALAFVAPFLLVGFASGILEAAKKLRLSPRIILAFSVALPTIQLCALRPSPPYIPHPLLVNLEKAEAERMYVYFDGSNYIESQAREMFVPILKRDDFILIAPPGQCGRCQSPEHIREAHFCGDFSHSKGDYLQLKVIECAPTSQS